MDYKTLKEKYTEVIDKRTQVSKTFDKGNGSYTLVASRTPIHYTDEDGKFQEIDLRIVDGKIDKNFYKVELLTDCIGYSIVSRQDNSRIDVKLKKIGDKDITYSIPTIEGNKAHWYDVDTDVDFFIEFRGYRTRCWKVLKSAKASKDITFEVFEDDVEKKDLRVVDKIVGYDASGKPTIQAKLKGEETKKKAEVSKKDIKSYELKQTFSEKVITKDPQTRVKSESTEVTYPVYIDADVEVSIGNTSDDGFDAYAYRKFFFPPAISQTYGPSSFIYTDVGFNVISNLNYSNTDAHTFGLTGTFIQKTNVNHFTRFDGITIPQSATIDDATLNLYAGYLDYGDANPQIKVYAFDENDPNAPTAAGDLINKTTGIASNVVTTTFTNIITNNTTTPPTKGMFDLYDIDVSDIVQELVNSYAYSNEAMLFFYRNKYEYSAGPFGGGGSINRVGSVYNYDWGSTKAPELVINYTSSGPTPSPTGYYLYYRKSDTTYSGIIYDSADDMTHYINVYVPTTGSGFVELVETTASGASNLRVRKGGTTYAMYIQSFSEAPTSSYIEIQRGSVGVANTSETDTPTSFASLTSAFVLNKSNRFCTAGPVTTDSTTYYVDDLSGRIELTDTDEITLTRLTAGNSSDFQMDWESLEYKGDAGGANEFIVRHRATTTVGAGGTSVTSFDTTPTDIENCIPFITGISNTDTGANSNGLTATANAYDNSGTATVALSRGGSSGTTIVQWVLVEFTGSNWTVSKASQSASSSDSGTATLGTTLSDISNAFIAQHQSLAASGDTDEAIADNYPVSYISNTTTITWAYDAQHAATNSQLFYVLENSECSVTRYSDTSSTAGYSNIDITSAGLTDISKAAIFGTSRSSGTGTAFARGWRNYEITSTTNARHFCHRSGNTMEHRIEIVDFSSMS